MAECLELDSIQPSTPNVDAAFGAGVGLTFLMTAAG